ncbi:unnamed protein product, partial [Meganyctiphanes norvegica]
MIIINVILSLQDDPRDIAGPSTRADPSVRAGPSGKGKTTSKKKVDVEKRKLEVLEIVAEHVKKVTDGQVLAEGWGMIFDRLPPDQQMLAKKGIDDILFEGSQGNLRTVKDPIPVSAPAPPPIRPNTVCVYTKPFSQPAAVQVPVRVQAFRHSNIGQLQGLLNDPRDHYNIE